MRLRGHVGYTRGSSRRDAPTARTELGHKATTLAQLGRHAEAAEALELYLQLVPANARDQQRILIVKTLLGQTSDVIASLENTFTRGRHTGFASFVLFDPELAPLRADPAFAALAEKARAVYADVPPR